MRSMPSKQPIYSIFLYIKRCLYIYIYIYIYILCQHASHSCHEVKYNQKAQQSQVEITATCFNSSVVCLISYARNYSSFRLANLLNLQDELKFVHALLQNHIKQQPVFSPALQRNKNFKYVGSSKIKKQLFLYYYLLIFCNDVDFFSRNA